MSEAYFFFCSFIYLQCTVWPYLTKFRHIVQKLQVFGKSLTIYFLFGKMLSPIWQNCDLIELIFIVANGQLLKNDLTIWSHWQCADNSETVELTWCQLVREKESQLNYVKFIWLEIDRHRPSSMQTIWASWGLFHKTFVSVIYGKMAINYGVFVIMTKFTVKIWPSL